MPATQITAPPAAVRAVQLLLLGPLGTLVIFGAIYFGVIAPPGETNAIDVLIGAWALAVGLGNLFVGARLGAGGPALRRLGLALVAAHLAFGIVKVAGYGEGEAATFIAIDVLALALLSSPRTRRFFDGPR